MWPTRPNAAGAQIVVLLGLWTLILIRGVHCLRIRQLMVPESVWVGAEWVRLSCVFDPETEELYSVKWFKDDVEFFRFLPRERPVYQTFDIGDVQVDMSRLSNGTVYLLGLQRSAEGTYRCEVSADAPSFHSISAEKYMAVEDPPPSSFAQPLRWIAGSCLKAATLMVLLAHVFYG